MRIQALLAVGFLTPLGSIAASQDSRQILDASDVQGGLVVVLGCDSPKLLAGLRASESYLVHGLDRDPKKVAAARSHLREAGVYGPVTASRWDGSQLPLVDNLAKLIVLAEDAEEVSENEIVRVLSPLGVVVDEDGVYVYFGSYGLLCYDHEGRQQWKKPIPTPKSMYGVATSPILHGQRLILVLDDDANLPGSRLSRSAVIALDKVTGELVWKTPRPYNRSAWSTPMIWKYEKGADLVVLGNGRVYGYDPTTGAERWHVSGFAREPIAVPVAGNGQLYVSASMQGGRGDVELDPEPFWNAMLHFDRDRDGRIGRDEITRDFTLPFRPELPPGHPGFGMPLAEDPGHREWQQNGLFDWRDRNNDGFWTKEEFAADMRVGAGQPNLAAIRPGGRGDVTESHVQWNLRRGIPEIPSPVFHAGRLYLVRAGGILSCVCPDTGEVVYRERLGAAGQYSASPVIADGHLVLVSNRGVLTVVKCGDEFTITHQTDLHAPIAATPAMDRNSIYVRADDALMAFR